VGRNFFIRVSAETYDEKELIRTWPALCTLVWPDEGAQKGGILRNLLPGAGRGVLQLVDAFVEYVHFGKMPGAARSDLTPAATELAKKRAELDEALGNRDVRAASGLTDAIEDALDEAESVAKRLRA